MTAMILPIKAGMEWNNNKITDHNREPISVDPERIELSKRMANGTLRKYVVADKRKFSTSWSDLPDTAAQTVDGFWGGREIEAFWKATKGAFTLRLNYGNGTSETVTVVFSRFNKSQNTRSVALDMWDVDVELEEV